MENQTYVWDPLQQFGTAWVLTAVPHDVQVIFWICVVKAIFAVMTMLSGICNLCSKDDEEYDVKDDEENPNMTRKMTPYKSNTRAKRSHSSLTNIFQLAVPILGLCAILLDSQEVLKAFCIVILISLVIIGFGVCFVLVPILTAGCCAGCCCGNSGFAGASVCIALVSIVVVGLATCLQIVSIVFAWGYAFPTNPTI